MNFKWFKVQLQEQGAFNTLTKTTAVFKQKMMHHLAGWYGLLAHIVTEIQLELKTQLL